MEQELVPEARSESLFKAANAIDVARDFQHISAAARDAAVAIEYHLDTLARELAARDGVDPGLRSRAQGVDARLRALLSQCWEYQRLAAEDAVDPDRIAAFVRNMRNVAARGGLVFAQLYGGRPRSISTHSRNSPNHRANHTQTLLLPPPPSTAVSAGPTNAPAVPQPAGYRALRNSPSTH
jgi:hypothetical protein